MEYYAEVKKNEFLLLVTAWMELETIILSANKPVNERQIPYDLTYNGI